MYRDAEEALRARVAALEKEVARLRGVVERPRKIRMDIPPSELKYLIPLIMTVIGTFYLLYVLARAILS